MSSDSRQTANKYQQQTVVPAMRKFKVRQLLPAITCCSTEITKRFQNKNSNFLLEMPRQIDNVWKCAAW